MWPSISGPDGARRSHHAGPAAPSLAWRVDLGGGLLYSSPSVSDAGVVVVCGGSAGVFALRGTDGHVLWQTASGLCTCSSSPTLSGDVAFVGCTQTLVALDMGTGARRWAFSGSGASFAHALVLDGTIIVGSADGGIYAIDASDGAPRWLHACKGAIHGAPVAGGGLVFAAAFDGTVVALNPSTGAVAWEATPFGPGAPTAATPVFDISTGSLLLGSLSHAFVSLDALGDGSVRWLHDCGGEVHAVAALSIAGDVAIVGTSGGSILALNVAMGAVAWTVSIPGAAPVRSGVAASADGQLLVGSDDGGLYSIQTGGTSGGSISWRVPTGGEIYSSPALGSTACAYAASYDGYVYAVGACAATSSAGGGFGGASPGVVAAITTLLAVCALALLWWQRRQLRQRTCQCGAGGVWRDVAVAPALKEALTAPHPLKESLEYGYH